MNKRPELWPKFDADGRLRPESLRTLDTSQISEWIITLICEEDSSITAGWDASVPGIIGQIYRTLDAQTRDCFQDSILYLLGSLLEPASRFSETAAEDVLLLAATVFRGSFRAAEPVRFLLRLAESAGAENPELDRIAWRAVQALVEIGHRAAPKFWRRVHEKGGDNYLAVVFGGFCLFSPKEAFDWIGEHLSRPSATEALISHLPLLVEAHGAEAITPLLDNISQNLSGNARALIWKFSAQLGLRVTQEVRESPFREWVAEDLKVLAHGLGLPVEPFVHRGDFVDQLETWLDRQSSAMGSMESAPFPVRIMYAALKSLPKPIGFPERIARSLAQTASSICDAFFETHVDEVFQLYEASMIYHDRVFEEYGSLKELPVPAS